MNDWPQESLESERRFGCAQAKLYPFIDKRVATKKGAGKLFRVLSDEAGPLAFVALDPERLVRIRLKSAQSCRPLPLENEPAI